MSKLADGGVLLCNASNRHVDVPHILAAIAGAKGYECLVCTDDPAAEDHPERVAAEWVVPCAANRPGPGLYNGFPPVGTLSGKGAACVWPGIGSRCSMGEGPTSWKRVGGPSSQAPGRSGPTAIRA